MLYSLPAVWETVFDNRLMNLKKIQTIRMPITGDKIAIKWLFAPVRDADDRRDAALSVAHLHGDSGLARPKQRWRCCSCPGMTDGK